MKTAQDRSSIFDGLDDSCVLLTNTGLYIAQKRGSSAIKEGRKGMKRMRGTTKVSLVPRQKGRDLSSVDLSMRNILLLAQ
jgi:hypothetical protein